MATNSEALTIAVQHHQAGRLQAAEQIYRQILAVEPNNVNALHLVGVVASQMGQYDLAIEHIGQAIRLCGTDAAFHNNLGEAYRFRGSLAEAVASYRRALKLNSGYAVAHNNLGIALMNQGELDDAVACYRRALQLQPAFAEAHNNLGIALKNQCKLDEALACHGRALELRPDYADAHWNRALVWLLMGDWQRGWAEHEWRWQTKTLAPRSFPRPLWNGASLVGKTILLHSEQGLGDTIQFVRYSSMVKRLGGTVLVDCQKPLLSLLEGCAGIDQLVGPGSNLPAFDVHAPFMSLPRIFKTELNTIPASIPYLAAKPALVEHWRQRLSELGGRDVFKIGICWQGNPNYPGDNFRSIPLRCFAPLARIPNVRLISLQKGAGAEQVAEVRDLFAVTDFAAELDLQSGPFMDTASVMKNLDLVISPHTAVAHLAGALGVAVWVAVPALPDWRWMLDRADCPWYPTMRLFRQSVLGNWSDVFDRMAAALPR